MPRPNPDLQYYKELARAANARGDDHMVGASA
jgi:hypothetical protein